MQTFSGTASLTDSLLYFHILFGNCSYSVDHLFFILDFSSDRVRFLSRLRLRFLSWDLDLFRFLVSTLFFLSRSEEKHLSEDSEEEEDCEEEEEEDDDEGVKERETDCLQ